jgi:hypothetical protein
VKLQNIKFNENPFSVFRVAGGQTERQFKPNWRTLAIFHCKHYKNTSLPLPTANIILNAFNLLNIYFKKLYSSCYVKRQLIFSALIIIKYVAKLNVNL